MTEDRLLAHMQERKILHLGTHFRMPAFIGWVENTLTYRTVCWR